MEELTQIILSETGLDLSHFDEEFIHRTLRMRMESSGNKNVTDYLDLLSESREECCMLSAAFLVNHSHFFRGRVNFALLNDHVLPAIFQEAGKKKRSVRIWSAGCAGGQEVWSMAMLCDSVKKELGFSNQTMVFGTDIAEEALEQARNGIYEREAVGQVSLRFFEDYFTIKKTKATIRHERLPHVSFSFCDLANDTHKYPPDSIFGNFDLVSCCNVLIYYKSAAQQKILLKLHEAILPGGFLMVDENERSIVLKCKSFKAIGLYSGLYKKH